MTDSYLASHLLHALAAEGNTTGLQPLLQRMDPGRRCQALQRRDADGFTPLLRAAEHGHQEVAELLIRMGAQINEAVTGEERLYPNLSTGESRLSSVCIG
jgi:ankyrin repeat protein